MARQPMPISSWWFQGAILTYLVGFTVLGVLAYLVYRDQPPLPAKVVASERTLFTREDVMSGMNVFQRYGLMEYGSVYGHGAYLGPDFTAEYLHKTAEFLVKHYQEDPLGRQSPRERVAAELHENNYDPVENKIAWSEARAEATMHHLYFSGTPVAHMALGATFSAMEVIPLLLLTLEAWGFVRSGEKTTVGGEHLHRWAVWFLVAVGVWNFLGAGVFGFLINLPVVSYYEIGTALTANHGHTAMMGVYGMLAIGLLLFCLRYLTRPDKWSDRAAMISFWSLNIGLSWMAFVNLFPLGIVQLYHAVDTGYWYARSFDFLMLRWVNILEWARLPGDALFILGGALPLVWLCWRALRYPNPRRAGPETELPRLLFAREPESGGSR